MRREPVELRAVQALKRPLVGVIIAGRRDRPGEHTKMKETDLNGFAYGPFLFAGGAEFGGDHFLFCSGGIALRCLHQEPKRSGYQP